MNGRQIAGLVAGLLLMSGVAAAQDEDRPRYRLPDHAVTTDQLEAILKRRLSQAEQSEQVRKLLDDFLKTKQFSSELRKLQNLLKQDPELNKHAEQNLLRPDVRKAIEDIRTQKIPTKEQIGDLLAKLNFPKDKLDRLPADLKSLLPPEQTLPDPPHLPDLGQTPFNPPPNNPLTGKDPSRNDNQSRFNPRSPDTTSEWFRKQASSWAGSFSKGIDSETLKGLVESFQRNGVMPSRLELPGWIKSTTSGISGSFKDWLPEFGQAPQFGNINLGGGWNFGTPDLPSLPSAETASKSTGFLFLLALIVVAAVVIYRTRGLGAFGPTDERGGRRLGPWPVAPEQVTTRGQLVQAFEYLARKVLGLPAETSHHREVGRQLAQHSATSEQEAAADDLASLYEQARYTPPSETLSPEELARAREALRLLATVNAA
jgi:hypothetical protein